MTFTRVCSLAEVPSDEGLAVDVDDLTVAVARDGEGTDAEVFAIQDLCSHASVSLSEGEVARSTDGSCQIECWLHGSMFDLRSGKPTGLPATEPVATFPVELRDGADGPDVYVDVTTTLNGVTPA